MGTDSAERQGQPATPWDDIKEQLAACLAQQEGWWGAVHGDGIRFCYDRYGWRETALCGDTVDWDDFESATDFARPDLPFTASDKCWFMFHKAAHAQPKLVTEAIRDSGLSHD